MNLTQMAQFLLSYRTPSETQKLEDLQQSIDDVRKELVVALEKEEQWFRLAGYPRRRAEKLKNEVEYYRRLEHGYAVRADRARRGETPPPCAVAIGCYAEAVASGASGGPVFLNKEPKVSVGSRCPPEGAHVAEVTIGKQEPAEDSMLIGYSQDSQDSQESRPYPYPIHPLLQGTQRDNPNFWLPRTAVVDMNVDNSKVTVGLPHGTPVTGHSSLVIGECPNKVQRVTEDVG